jgi:hypothetical protein
MKLVLNFTVFFYNTPVFFKVSKIDDVDYFAEPLDEKSSAFRFRKRYGKWYADGQSSHMLADQIGKLIDKSGGFQ